ncbi:MAG: hypothetical protein ACK4K5_10820, partial [Thermosynechococcus sp.]|uniref:hypothetical protein n=1 Tax=Thermosynechococcus sp. TaxID=2814275 RepID=UPI00391CE250
MLWAISVREATINKVLVKISQKIPAQSQPLATACSLTPWVTEEIFQDDSAVENLRMWNLESI